MRKLVINNVPDRLIERLKARATAHQRSLNRELIACLEATARSLPVDRDVLLARARAVRRIPNRLRLTDRILARLKRAGGRRASSPTVDCG